MSDEELREERRIEALRVKLAMQRAGNIAAVSDTDRLDWIFKACELQSIQIKGKMLLSVILPRREDEDAMTKESLREKIDQMIRKETP
jgi:hypothetical protein